MEKYIMTRKLFVVLCLLLCFAACGKTEDAKDAKDTKNIILSSVEIEMLADANAERTKYKLPPLVIDSLRQSQTRKHCIWMATTNSMRHTSEGVAENIACGQPNSKGVIRSWMNSSGHRNNILGGYTRVGVASQTSSTGQIYWCQQFSQ